MATKKQDIVYKVLNIKIYKSKYAKYPCYTSSSVPDNISEIYRLGRKTIPRIGKLFAFKTLNDAKDFSNCQFILKCKARISNNMKIDRILRRQDLDLKTITDFWNGVNILEAEDFLKDVWFNPEVVKFREKIIAGGKWHECPVYNLTIK